MVQADAGAGRQLYEWNRHAKQRRTRPSGQVGVVARLDDRRALHRRQSVLGNQLSLAEHPDRARVERLPDKNAPAGVPMRRE